MIIAAISSSACRENTRKESQFGTFLVDTLATAIETGMAEPIFAAPLGTGNVAIVDGKANEIVVVDSLGGVKARFGRSGSGPGEFSSVRGVWIAGDTVWGIDGRRDRRVGFTLRDGFVGESELQVPFSHQAAVFLNRDSVVHVTDGAHQSLAVLRGADGSVLARFGERQGSTEVQPFDMDLIKQEILLGRMPTWFANSVVLAVGEQRDVWLIHQTTGIIEHFDVKGTRLGAASLPEAHVAARLQVFRETNRALQDQRVALPVVAYAAALMNKALWVLLASADSAPARLLRVDESLSLSPVLSIPGLRGSRTLTVEPLARRFLLVAIAEGLVYQLTLARTSASPR